MEVWKTHPYHQDYEISDSGLVRSLKKQQPRILKQSSQQQGYKVVCLFTDGKKETCYVQRLVLETFCPQEGSAFLEANHINMVVYDNRLTNLEWVTPEQNKKLAREIRGPKKSRNSMAYDEVKRSNQRRAMWGRTHSDETKEKISKANGGKSRCYNSVITPEGEFDSFRSAAKHFNMTPSAVYFKVQKGDEGWRRGDRILSSKGKYKLTDPNGCTWNLVHEARKSWNLTAYKMSCILHDKEFARKLGWTVEKIK